MNKFNEFRNKYKNFIYDNYEVILDDNGLLIKQHYIIENLTDFNTELIINKEYITNKIIDINTINSLAFHIGLIELLSYYKATCSPNIIIKCGYLCDRFKFKINL